jgi:hypothetical protein
VFESFFESGRGNKISLIMSNNHTVPKGNFEIVDLLFVDSNTGFITIKGLRDLNQFKLPIKKIQIGSDFLSIERQLRSFQKLVNFPASHNKTLIDYIYGSKIEPIQKIDQINDDE